MKKLCFDYLLHEGKRNFFTPYSHNLEGPSLYIIKTTAFKFQVSIDIWGYFDSAIASEATKMAFKGNMNRDRLKSMDQVLWMLQANWGRSDKQQQG